MKKLTVTYVKPAKSKQLDIIPSCPTYTVEHEKLDDGVAMTIDQYIDAQIAHPSIIGVMHAAVKTPGTAVSVEVDDISALYFGEVGAACATEGFTFKVADV